MAGLPYPIRLAGFGLRKPKYPQPGPESGRNGREPLGNEVDWASDPGDDVFAIGAGSFAAYVGVRTGQTHPSRRTSRLRRQLPCRPPGPPPSRPCVTTTRSRPVSRRWSSARREGGQLHRADREGVPRRGHRCTSPAKVERGGEPSAPTMSSTTPAKISPTVSTVRRGPRLGREPSALRFLRRVLTPREDSSSSERDGWSVAGRHRPTIAGEAAVPRRQPKRAPSSHRSSRRRLSLLRDPTRQASDAGHRPDLSPQRCRGGLLSDSPKLVRQR